MMSDIQSGKALRGAAYLSVVLAIIKAIAFALSGSLLVLTSLVDSVVDAIVSESNFRILRLSKEDADQEHPFGHGGFEVIGSLVQGMVLVLFGFSLLIESLRRLFDKVESHLDVASLPMAISVLLFSALGGYLIQWFLDRKIKSIDPAKERSLSLSADHAHYLTDVITNMASAVGLFLVWYYEIPKLDAVFSVVASLFFLKAAYPVLQSCYFDITHKEASPELQKKIVEIVKGYDERIKGVHCLRSRELGPSLFVDFHMTLDSSMSLKEAHDLGEDVEAEIRKVIPRGDILIHLDPDTEEEHEAWDPSY